jgi:hypothetical protein
VLEKDLVLEALEKHARPIMLTAVRPDSCIAMTACAIEVLKYFGYPDGEPMNVECIAVNEKFQELCDAGRIRVDERLPDWAVELGAWAVGVGVDRPVPKSGAGHVVCLSGDKMVDLSIDQASRRLKNMELRPAVYQLPESLSKVVNVGEQVHYYQGKTLLVYVFRPDLNTYHDSPDWTRFKERYSDPVGRIIKAMKRELA